VFAEALATESPARFTLAAALFDEWHADDELAEVARKEAPDRSKAVDVLGTMEARLRELARSRERLS
jgi:hypothetical protein